MSDCSATSPVFFWGFFVNVVENRVEVADVAKTRFVAYVRNFKVCVGEQVCGVYYFQFVDELGGCYAHIFFHCS